MIEVSRRNVFWETLKLNSSVKTDLCIREWILCDKTRGADRIIFDSDRKKADEASHCICGNSLTYVYIVFNPITKISLVVGSCCINRFPFTKLKWAGKRNYLYSSLEMCKCDVEKIFVRKLIDELTEYHGDRFLFNWERMWLEAISHRRYKYETW